MLMCTEYDTVSSVLAKVEEAALVPGLLFYLTLKAHVLADDALTVGQVGL